MKFPSIEKKLFTPGPLTTSQTVKQSMLRDFGSRDKEFIASVENIRERLLELSKVTKGNYETILMQGSGTFGIESVICSTVPAGGKLLVIINGAYGHRINRIAKRLGIETIELIYDEDSLPNISDIDKILAENNEITNAAVVHCETTTGIINPILEIGKIVKKYNVEYIVDAMSSFGAYEINLENNEIDFLISSANKCIEGVPGFSFILAKTEVLKTKENYSKSTSLDLYEQWIGLEKNGQFRFTPPTHSIMAFQQALNELYEEGGTIGRANRYKKNHSVLIEGMAELGFVEYIDRQNQGHIITSFIYPDNEGFSFEKFYNLLSEKGLVIYPGKLSNVDCFRIGNIGQLFETDMKEILDAIKELKKEMDF
ncbi:MAG: 2-aminoethylphosphonate--pyruvate transaminase [Ignavibacteriae bacterium]|nr:2-aminoethylphosphonate--pyruvate transaminase [Ignavibacteriota bacterium]